MKQLIAPNLKEFVRVSNKEAVELERKGWVPSKLARIELLVIGLEEIKD
jgi:hypothetical protein